VLYSKPTAEFDKDFAIVEEELEGSRDKSVNPAAN
jgi:hypothetical protein